jgi:hypothetical protein
VEVSEIEAVDIDEEEDFMIADAIYNHLIKKNLWGELPLFNYKQII